MLLLLLGLLVLLSSVPAAEARLGGEPVAVEEGGDAVMSRGSPAGGRHRRRTQGQEQRLRREPSSVSAMACHRACRGLVPRRLLIDRTVKPTDSMVTDRLTVHHAHPYPHSLSPPTQWADSETYLPASAAIDMDGGRELLQVGETTRGHVTGRGNDTARHDTTRRPTGSHGMTDFSLTG